MHLAPRTLRLGHSRFQASGTISLETDDDRLAPFFVDCADLRDHQWMRIASSRRRFPQKRIFGVRSSEETRLGRHFINTVRQQGGNSGFRIIPAGVDGFLIRMQMINAGGCKKLRVNHHNQHRPHLHNYLSKVG